MTISIETAIRTRLVSSDAVRAILGDRLAPHWQSQRTARPFGCYSRIDGDHQRHLGGASGLLFARIQFDFYADDYLQLEALVEAVRNCLDGFRGTISVGAEQLVIQQVALVDEYTTASAPTDGSDAGPHRHRLDFRISALEPVPTLT